MNPVPRLAAAAVAAAARAMPVVVVTGARQAGKSTLARMIAPPGRAYFTLDDLDVLDQARSDPSALVRRASPVTLDEVQRAPDLLLAIKREVDRNRERGRFLLTGSANLLLMGGVSDTLAGRASYLTLWPMTRGEQLGHGRCGAWPELLETADSKWPALIQRMRAGPADWRALARSSGYPTPALELDAASRETWFAGYAQTYLERDLGQISSVSNLPDFRRLMRAVCLRLGQLMNQTELGRDVSLPQPTVHRWLNLLEVSYQLVRVPAYAVNRTKRLIKAPKLYWSDTAMALHLAGGDPSGAHLENVVLNDLIAWRDTAAQRPEICYWRTAIGEEVDFVIDARGTLLPIEIKASDTPRTSDIKHLLAFKAEYGKRSRAGLLLHTGTAIEWLAPGVLAAPWWAVL